MEQTTRIGRRDAYLAALRPSLADLDDIERAEVLDELTAALDETAAMHDGPLADVLGPPPAYIAAYRASAGLGLYVPAGPSRRRRLHMRASTWLQTRPWWPRAVAVGRLLRPSWWTVRGAALAALAVVLVGLADGLVQAFTLPTAILLVVGVALSMTAGPGRSTRRGRRLLHRAGNIVAAFLLLALLDGVAALSDQAYGRGWTAGYYDGLAARADSAGPSGEERAPALERP